MRGITLAMCLTMSGLLAGCAVPAQSSKPTSLELQSIQSQEFETKKSVAFAATLSVFQDMGYIIEGADRETGFITAKSASENSANFFEIMAAVSSNSHTKATAFVEELRPGTTKVRLNFVVSKSTSSSYGQQNTKDKAIVDPTVYQNAFEKIGEAVFIRQG